MNSQLEIKLAPKMTDTPETDAAYKNHAWDMHDHIPLEFARKLERERDEARGLAESNGKLAHACACESMQYRRERDELVVENQSWKAEAKRWRDMYIQYDEILEKDLDKAKERITNVIAKIKSLDKEINKKY